MLKVDQRVVSVRSTRSEVWVTFLLLHTLYYLCTIKRRQLWILQMVETLEMRGLLVTVLEW